jgi:riboflavin synthase
MFTGIITGVGQIAEAAPMGASAAHGKRLHVQCPAGYLDDVGLGDSIAINGACMTVTSLEAGRPHAAVHRGRVSRVAGQNRRPGRGPARSIWKKPCAPTTVWAGIWSPATWTASAASSHFAPCGRKLGAARAGTGMRWASTWPTKALSPSTASSLTVNRVADSAEGCEVQHQPDSPHRAATRRCKHLNHGARVNLEIDLIARYVERLCCRIANAGAPRACR